MNEPSLEERLSLLELLDRVLDKGVVLTGDITLAVADVDLVYVGLRVLVSSVETAHRLADDHEGSAADAAPISWEESLR